MKLLEQARQLARTKHFSIRTEKAYVYWIARYIRFHGLPHPNTMAAPEVETFLTHLAVAGHVSASTHMLRGALLTCIWKSVYYDGNAQRRELACARDHACLKSWFAMAMSGHVRSWQVFECFRVSCPVAENVRKCHALDVFLTDSGPELRSRQAMQQPTGNIVVFNGPVPFVARAQVRNLGRT